MYTFVLTQRGGESQSCQANCTDRVRTSSTFLLRREHPQRCNCGSPPCAGEHRSPIATITSVRRVVRIELVDDNGEVRLLHCLKERVYLYTLFPDPYMVRRLERHA